MTYIEFFDKIASENICACLTYAPDRVVYIGDSAKIMKAHIANYEKIFSGRSQKIEFSYKTVDKSNLDRVVRLLTELVETYDDCVFDITGGEELLIFALGIVYAQHPDRNIQIHKLNLRNNTIYDCDKDGRTIYRETPTLSVEENIGIYGGKVVYGSLDEEKTYRWDLTEEFLLDAERIWSICKKDVRWWNVQIGIFEAAETVGNISDDGLTVTVSHAALQQYLQRDGMKYRKSNRIINELYRYGLITYFDDEHETTFSVSYKNRQVRKCLTKAGQALELKVYLAAKAVQDGGVPVYDDVINGVVIDWDGELHDETLEEVYDTENEIDVLLMHDVVPVFISCKNGIVTSDELYKLNTVAERFGGIYAKKVLVATAIDSLGEAGKYLRQRAKDMNIRLLDDICELDDAELLRKMKSLWNT